MHRVKHDKEMDLMTPLTNRSNSQRFSDLVGHFFYDHDTEKEIKQNLSPLTKPFPANYFDQRLDLNSQFRAWYEVPIDRANDLAFDQYERMIYNNFLHFQWSTETYNETGKIKDYGTKERDPDKSELEMITKVNLCNKYFIDDYNIWERGKVLIGKNQQKLFKYCLKKGLLYQEQVDKLNTLKTKENNLYICVTRNPVDYLFSSTNQSFTSCLDTINSVGEGCYWMGLGALNTDNSRAMVFLSNGKVKDFTLHGYRFRHFGYLSRAWMFLGDHDKLYILGAYPEDKIGFFDKLNEAELPVDQLNNFEQSRLNFNLSKFENGDECNIYLDTLGVESRRFDDLKNRTEGNKRIWFYTNGGGTGSLHHWDYDGTFEDISHFEDLFEGGNYCEDCGDFFGEDNGYYFENIGSLCENCYNRHYISCFACGNTEHNDNSCTGPDNMDYCENCFNESFTLCECGESVETEEITYVENDSFCTKCLYEHCFECEKCNDFFLHEDRWMHNGREYCRDCHYELFVACDNCGEDVDIDYAVDIDYVSYCADCAEKIKEERDEAIN